MKKGFLFLSVFYFVGTAHATVGGVDGGGGKAVVCRNTEGKILSAETLDLYEAKNIYGLQPIAFSGSFNEAIQHVKENLKSTMDQPEVHLFPLFDRVQRIMKLVPPSVVIKPVDDAAEVVLPNECKLEQLAYYVDDDLLLVSDEIWKELKIADKVALVAHEAIYRMERFGGAKDSRRSRKIVGHVMSDFPFQPVRDGVSKDAAICMATRGNRPTYQFSYYPSNDGGMTVLQFYWFEGKAVFSKKTAVLPIRFPGNLECGGNNDCRQPAVETSSNFEGAGRVVLGAESHVDVEHGIVERKLYLLSDTGKHYLNCSL